MSEHDQKLLKNLTLKLGQEVLGAYIQGSRLWGTGTSSSDYDLLVIVKEGGKGSTHIGTTHDVTYMGERVFLERIQNNCVYELCAACAPNDTVLKPYEKMPQIDEVLRPTRLKDFLTSELPKILDLSAKFGSKGDPRREAKLYSHAYHLLQLSHQLATTGSIVDFTMDLRTFHATLALSTPWDQPDWDAARAEYLSMHSKLLAVLP